MVRSLVRGLAVGVLGLAAAGVVQGQQSIEVFAGGRLVQNLPATQTPLTPGKLAIGPDGIVYVVNDFTHLMMRRDPNSGTMTVGAPGPANSAYNFTTYAFFNRPGYAWLLRDFTLFDRNLSTGATTNYGLAQRTNPYCGFPHPHEGDMAAGSNGITYFTDTYNNALCRYAAPNTVQRAGGGDVAGFAGDGGPASGALFSSPKGVAVDASNNIYIADAGNNRIRKITAATGVISTFMGDGTWTFGGENVPAAGTPIRNPSRMAFDPQGNLYVVEHPRVRRIDMQTGLVTTVAGNGTFGSDSPDGSLATDVPLGWIESIGIRPNGDIFLSDSYNLRVRRVEKATGTIWTAIGNGTTYFCGENSAPRDACLHEPQFLAADANGDVYISDTVNRRVRKVSAATGMLTTVAGRANSGAYSGEGGLATNAVFAGRLGAVALDATGNLYISNGDGYRLSRVDRATGIITTIAGTGQGGFTGDGGPATAARVGFINGIAVKPNGDVYFSDRNAARVRRISAATGTITTVAGNGQWNGAVNDGGPATSASITEPYGVGFDRSGDLLIADFLHNRIRKVNLSTGIITTVAGNGTVNSTGDGGPATAAGINNARSFVLDPAGNIMFVDTGRVRRIDATTGIITSISPAGLRPPEGHAVHGTDLALDSNGRLYIAGYDVVLRMQGLPIPNLDTTPPQVFANVNGATGPGGWYRSDVQVSWSVSDNDSAVTSTAGCASSSVTTDTSGVTFTCSATSSGGTTSSSITIQRDTQAPTLEFDSGWMVPDENGWHNTDVVMPFTASDALSGVWSTSKSSPLLITGQGEGLSDSVVVTDLAGNSATFTAPLVNIDRTPPVLTPVATGTLGNNGWYTSAVDVEWTVTDPESPIISSEGCYMSRVNLDSAGTSFTCTARSSGRSATRTFTVKKDSTPPLVRMDMMSPLPDESGWNSTDVQIHFIATDDLSAVTTSAPSPVTITGTGSNLTFDVTATDEAGNQATFTTPVVNIDRSAPAVTAEVSGTLGANGWYTSDVQVVWAVSDDGAPVGSTTGCEISVLNADTAGTTLTCTATTAGGTTTQSISLKRDASPPQLEFGAPSPAANASGWHSGDVSFPFTTTDALSGVASTSTHDPVVVGGEGANLVASVTVTDQAGNSATVVTPPVNIDRSPPAVQPIVTGTLGANGWYTSDVAVSWAIDESPTNILSTTGCGNGSVAADSTGVTFACTVVSGGGTAAASVTIKRDATAPAVTFATGTPAPNAAGWVKGNVSVAFTASDAGSGIASTSAASPLVLSTEGSGITGQVSVTDQAGNAATFTTPAYNLDKALPVVTLTAPANGVIYGFYQDLPAQFTCTDASLVSCTGTVAQGAMVNTRTPGNRTFTVTARDQVSNTTTVNHRYTVMSFFELEGFLAPMAATPTLNVITRGAMVPLRWRLPDGHGGYVTSTASFTSATVSTVSCGGAPSAPLNDVATGAAGIGFDAATNAFTYNWQTSASWTGCRKVVIKLKDNSTWEARFRLQ